MTFTIPEGRIAAQRDGPPRPGSNPSVRGGSKLEADSCELKWFQPHRNGATAYSQRRSILFHAVGEMRREQRKHGRLHVALDRLVGLLVQEKSIAIVYLLKRRDFRRAAL